MSAILTDEALLAMLARANDVRGSDHQELIEALCANRSALRALLARWVALATGTNINQLERLSAVLADTRAALEKP